MYECDGGWAGTANFECLSGLRATKDLAIEFGHVRKSVHGVRNAGVYIEFNSRLRIRYSQILFDRLEPG